MSEGDGGGRIVWRGCGGVPQRDVDRGVVEEPEKVAER